MFYFKYKTNEIVNKFLLAGDKFMSEMHLRQPRFTYSACEPFTKNKERIQKLKKQEIQAIFTKINQRKHVLNMIWLMEILKMQLKEDVTFKIASDQKYDRYQRGLASMVYKFFDKKSSGSGLPSNKENMQIANEFHKPIIRKLKKRKLYPSFRDNIWGVDLADMQLLSKFNKGFRFLLCVIDIFSKYAWVIPLKDKKRHKYC